GYILTGTSDRQYNLANTLLDVDAGWVGYDAATAPRKPYTCGSCHTTGWIASDSAGAHQDDLPGIYGTWSEPGVRCEACHGASADHVSSPFSVKPASVERCGKCHARGDVNLIDASGGLIKHHEQYEDLLASPHKTLGCTDCHDPHLSTKYGLGGYKGTDASCNKCHSAVEIKLASKANFECYDCHMPFAAKSAVSITIEHAGGTVPVGDIRTHINRINSDPTWKMFTDDGNYVRTDAAGKAYITLDYACLSCHTNRDINWAAENALAIHQTGTGVELAESKIIVPAEYALHQNYPNPFNPETTISFDIKQSGKVVLKIFNTMGQELFTLLNQNMPAGTHRLTFSADNLTSGIYIYTLSANEYHSSRKMIFIR
ncbi:MAG: T9SS type A sorting domain-containing protein, partial [bacterium]|nr:T9SS type A sorting domain-containing protein [bacterium]